MSDVKKYLDEVTTAVGEATADCTKFVEEGVMSAGSKARKSLIAAKKSVNALRKAILASQKETKQAKKATKVDKKSE
jgi:hypothetical protein